MKKCTSLFVSIFLFATIMPAGKKQQLLSLSKKYFPENYAVLKEYDDASIDGMTTGESLKEYISDVSTVVHEGYHSYLSNHSSYFDDDMLYRINDTLSFAVKNFKTFPAKEINSIVPVAIRKKVFRYDTYVNSESKYHVTQQFGILGLLEECAAYYQSFATDVALFSYYKDQYGWKDPKPWMKYLGNMASFRYAITEFELFISWYMQYAKMKHPSVYRDIVADKGLKKLFVFLEKENTRLNSLYDQNREILLKQFGGKLEIMGNFIYSKATHTGKGLYDDEVKEMQALLQKPEHKILDELRKTETGTRFQ